MGIFTSCCKPSASDVLTPDAETRRRQQVEAAERRQAEQAARGVKDPERVKRMQQRAEEMDKRQQELQKDGGPTLRWTSE
ncbi:small VCP interacting protein [Aphomia sociella]